MSKPKVSVVILSYNTKNLLRDCLTSIRKSIDEIPLEVIVVDNASSDGSADMVHDEFKWVELIRNKKNIGFAAGNNTAKDKARGEYVLILNPDTVVPKGTIKETAEYLTENANVGAVTCKTLLPDGKLDRDSRRSFPTPMVAFTHFSGFDRLFPKSKLFSKYWYGYIDEDTEHEVDVVQGAYNMTRRQILDELGWFDEDYFLDGEDIDLCWRIKQKGWKIMYLPTVNIIHVKGAAKGKNKSLKNRPNYRQRYAAAMRGVDSMEIFYRKHLLDRYPLALNIAVILGIKGMKIVRLVKRVLL